MSDEKELISREDWEHREITDRKEWEENLVNRLFDQITGLRKPPKYRPQFLRTLLQHMGIEGKSYTSLQFKLGIACKQTMYLWEKKYPEWKEAKEMAQAGRIEYCESLLQNLASGKNKGNAAAAIFYAKNAAPDEFKDKREMEVTGGVTYVIDTGIPSKQKQIPQQLSEEIIEAEFEQIEKEENDEDLL